MKVTETTQVEFGHTIQPDGSINARITIGGVKLPVEIEPSEVPRFTLALTAWADKLRWATAEKDVPDDEEPDYPRDAAEPTWGSTPPIGDMTPPPADNDAPSDFDLLDTFGD